MTTQPVAPEVAELIKSEQTLQGVAAAAHALYTYTCKHYEITLWEGSGL